jgi:uncharacterized membrane protein YhdT
MNVATWLFFVSRISFIHLHKINAMRLAVGFIFIIIFLVRMIYRGLVTRDLRQNPDELYLGLGFVAMWAVVYTLIYIS